MKVRENLFANGNIPAQVKDWFLTDDDCLQYCKMHPYDKKHGTYQFVQYFVYDGDDYYVITDTVDIYDFIGVDDEQAYEYIINILESYGYGITIIREDMDDKEWSEVLLKEFKSQYGDDWKRILAECMFEDRIFSADEIDKHLTYGQMLVAMSNFLQDN